MIIAVEGPDGIGKTTLVQKLSKYYNLPNTSNFYRLSKDEYNDHIDVTTECYYSVFESFKDVDFIADRFIISDILYDKSRNRPNYMTIDNILDEFPQVFFIFLYGYLDYVLTNHIKGDILYSREELEKIYRLYEEFIFKVIENNNVEYRRIFFIDVYNKTEGEIFEKAKRLIDDFIVINRK